MFQYYPSDHLPIFSNFSILFNILLSGSILFSSKAESIIASFNVEDFSLDRQRTLTPKEIDERFHQLEEIVRF